MRYKVLDLEFPPTILLKAATHACTRAPRRPTCGSQPARAHARARVATLPGMRADGQRATATRCGKTIAFTDQALL